MILKKDGSLIKRFSVVLCLSLVLNCIFVPRSYAAEGVAAQNPLFVPASAFVAAALIGSGMIAKNSQDAINAADSLVNKILTQIKSSEVEKTESDPAYDSPFRVINGGQPEKPNNQNQNGKWVALAGGALATGEIYANKDAIEDILRRANSLGGYKQSTLETGVLSLSDSKLLTVANASGVALQLANFSNKLVTQFNEVIHSDAYNNWVSSANINPDHVVYAVTFDVQTLLAKSNIYPFISVSAFDLSNVGNIRLEYNMVRNHFEQNENSSFYSGSYDFDTPVSMLGYASDSYWRFGICKLLNNDSVSVNSPYAFFKILSRSAEQASSVSLSSSGSNGVFSAFDFNKTSELRRGYAGFKWLNVNPIQFTNNVYNPQVTFDQNFTQWVQGQIQTLGGQIVDAVRLGLTSANLTWNPNQQQIQSGVSPSSVIYQLINNYENPENIPNDEPQPEPDPDPEPAPEPLPTDEYLGNFLLPETITTKFPFCIPFDVARCLRLFSTSAREAPRWECDLGYGSSTYHVVIDLSMFNDVANFIRPLEYILFLVGLAVGTRALIRG